MSRPLVSEVDAYMGLANDTRRRILEFVGRRPRSAGEIASQFAISQPAVSQHLRVLRQAHLVTQQRHGMHRIYAINRGPLRQVAAWMNETVG